MSHRKLFPNNKTNTFVPDKKLVDKMHQILHLRGKVTKNYID